MGIKSFDSLEAMMDEMAAQEAAANASVTERQKRDLGWGTHGFRLVRDIPIWTHVYTQAEAFEGEDDHTVDLLHNSYERGYRYGMHYSRLEPRGELGSVHIASMWPISKRDFDIAREAGWYPQGEFEPWFRNFIAVMLRQMDDASHGVYHSKFDADEDEGQTFFPVDEGKQS